MPVCKKVLVPVDLEDFSKKIVPYVKTVVDKFEAEVHLLFVERVLKEYTSGHVPDISITRKFEAEALEEAEEQLRAIADEHFKGCPTIKTSVIPGHAAEEITNYVRSEKIDLIILGTHGRKAIDHLVFGSVAEEVLKVSTVPVLAMNPSKLTSSKGSLDLSVEGDEEIREELDQYKS